MRTEDVDLHTADPAREDARPLKGMEQKLALGREALVPRAAAGRLSQLVFIHAAAGRGAR